MTLLCKKITVAKSRELKTRSNLAEYCEEGYGPKRALFVIDTDDYYSQKLSFRVFLKSVRVMTAVVFCIL
jgi:hypothetical protein